ncbi:hypothetical protein A1O7_03733 [Cladophialophora yegresii CBS 114405]|uniref:Uncharacterized protein n=1 Tax=Cladophialophora yegresii CBS 114405 TaxID=1182544 RepID=W9VV16_9EURO|nr:uncharacterized protein A1O7_03733 [Cladophialophora yegresii CBS 114405]EXJ59587.1 hypothetical protein A1O7_03733 [Cladophialophora yegresii CBS 114405]
MAGNDDNNHRQAQRCAQSESEDFFDNDLTALNDATPVLDSQQQTFPPTINSPPQGHTDLDNRLIDPLLLANDVTAQTSDFSHFEAPPEGSLYTDFLSDNQTLETNSNPQTSAFSSLPTVPEDLLAADYQFDNQTLQNSSNTQPSAFPAVPTVPEDFSHTDFLFDGQTLENNSNPQPSAFSSLHTLPENFFSTGYQLDTQIENNSNPQPPAFPSLTTLLQDSFSTDYPLDNQTLGGNETDPTSHPFAASTYNIQHQTAVLPTASFGSLTHPNTDIAPSGQYHEVSDNQPSNFDSQFRSLYPSPPQSYHTLASVPAGNIQHASEAPQSRSLNTSRSQSYRSSGPGRTRNRQRASQPAQVRSSTRPGTQSHHNSASSLVGSQQQAAQLSQVRSLPHSLNPTSTQPYQAQDDMARGEAQVGTIQALAIDRALRDFDRAPESTYEDVYRRVVQHYVDLVVTEGMPQFWISRLNLEVELARVIIVATRSPELYTRQHLDTLQELGDSMMREHRAERYRAHWLHELREAGITLDDVTVVHEDTAEYERRTEHRSWWFEWVQGTRPDDGTSGDLGSRAPTTSDNAGGSGLAGTGADVTVSNGRSQAVPSATLPSMPVPSRTRRRASNRLRSANTSAGGASSSRPVSAARPTRGNAGSNPLTVRVNGGRTTFAMNTAGGLVDFAEHQRGLRCPWTCLLGDSYVTPERGRLTGHLQRDHQLSAADLAHMLVENPNASDFEGHLSKDCFAWAQYTHGDPRPWKCLLCANHRGMRDGRNTLARHVRQTHGIQVALPAVRDVRQPRRRHQPGTGTTSEAVARQLEPVDGAEQQRAAGAAAQEGAMNGGLRLTLTGTKSSALDAGLDEAMDEEEEEGEEDEEAMEEE